MHQPGSRMDLGLVRGGLDGHTLAHMGHPGRIMEIDNGLVGVAEIVSRGKTPDWYYLHCSISKGSK